MADPTAGNANIDLKKKIPADRLQPGWRRSISRPRSDTPEFLGEDPLFSACKTLQRKIWEGGLVRRCLPPLEVASSQGFVATSFFLAHILSSMSIGRLEPAGRCIPMRCQVLQPLGRPAFESPQPGLGDQAFSIAAPLGLEDLTIGSRVHRPGIFRLPHVPWRAQFCQMPMQPIAIGRPVAGQMRSGHQATT